MLHQQVERGHSNDTGMLADFCDGAYYKNHSLFSVHKNALQIMMYYDDVEVCNALGSHTKVHKLGTCLHVYTLYIHTLSCMYIHVYNIIMHVLQASSISYLETVTLSSAQNSRLFNWLQYVNIAILRSTL